LCGSLLGFELIGCVSSIFEKPFFASAAVRREAGLELIIEPIIRTMGAAPVPMAKAIRTARKTGRGHASAQQGGPAPNRDGAAAPRGGHTAAAADAALDATDEGRTLRRHAEVDLIAGREPAPCIAAPG
jgi:hypothetical protein